MKVVIDEEKIMDLLENEWGYEGIREDVQRVLRENGVPYEEEVPNYAMGYQDGVRKVLKEVAEGKHRPQGEWITRHKENSFGQDVVCFECNKCGEYKLPIIHTMITEPLGVCPNCGVNMRKGGAEK